MMFVGVLGSHDSMLGLDTAMEKDVDKHLQEEHTVPHAAYKAEHLMKDMEHAAEVDILGLLSHKAVGNLVGNAE